MERGEKKCFKKETATTALSRLFASRRLLHSSALQTYSVARVFPGPAAAVHIKNVIILWQSGGYNILYTLHVIVV